MRVLHLIDAPGVGARPGAGVPGTTLALLADTQSGGAAESARVVLLGGTALGRVAEAAGVVHALRLGVPLSSAVLGWPTVRARLDSERSRETRWDAIHCWSIGAFLLAALRWPRAPRLLTLTTLPSAAALRWLRLAASDRGGRSLVLPITGALERALLAAGLPPDAVRPLRPGVHLGRAEPDRRAAFRRRWGIPPAADERVRVVALLSDPPAAADAAVGNLAAGLTEEAGGGLGNGIADGPPRPEIRLLVHPDAANRPRAERLNRALGRHGRLIQEPALAYPWRVLPACDAALALGSHAGGLSLLAAMAAGVPVVGEARYAVSELVEDRHSALLVKPEQPKALADALGRVLADARLAWALRDQARRDAYTHFSRQTYVESLRAVYAALLAPNASGASRTALAPAGP